MPSPFDTLPEIAPPRHATRIHIHCLPSIQLECPKHRLRILVSVSVITISLVIRLHYLRTSETSVPNGDLSPVSPEKNHSSTALLELCFHVSSQCHKRWPYA